MRLLGKITDATDARLVYGLLVSRKIGCRVESTRGGEWEVWALDEDQMLEARTLYRQFLTDPCKEQYAPLALVAEEADAAAAARRQAEAEDAARRRAAVSMQEFLSRPATVSWTVIGLCAAIWILQTLSPSVMLPYLLDNLQMAPLGGGFEDALRALSRGEIWRLFTPALLHSPVVVPGGETHLLGVLHVFFNLWWMKDLGPLVERRHGPWYLLGLLMAVAGGSNLAQLCVTGPNFLGLSGVVYGLLGFLWLRGKLDPGYGLRLNPGIVMFMLFWLLICWSTPGVANACHVAGLAIGALWGAAAALAARARR